MSGEFDPPGFPERLFLSFELGVALLHDTLEEFAGDGRLLLDRSADQIGGVAGLGLGWDFALGAGLAAGVTLHAEFITLPTDPPGLGGDRGSLAIGTGPWLELGVRFVVTD